MTVHFRSDAWIEPQLRYIERFLPADTAVYAALEGIDEEHFARYHFAEDLHGTHADKLDQLAAVALADADPDDILVFIDGDAFPIAPVGLDVLDGRRLAAVRRDEDLGEMYPHPCFCVTTAGFWSDLGSSWQAGPLHKNALGHVVTDVGCTLMTDLAAAGVEWTPLLRSNTTDLHPLWFGVYGGVVYHHGAGFRPRDEHLDARGKKSNSAIVSARNTRTPEWVPVLYRAERSLRYRAGARRGRKYLASDEALALDRLSDDVYQSVLDDPDFVEAFIG